MNLGSPRLHFRVVDSTNARARELAARGAPSGTIVTAAEQTAGRGRQGRTWSAPSGRALLCSLVLRNPPKLLPLAAGLAVAEVAGEESMVKWPNDVLVGGRKVAGVLVEGRPGEGWTVLGIGINVAIGESDLPTELRDRAGGLGRSPDEIEPILAQLLQRLSRWLSAPNEVVLASLRSRDALLGRHVRWAGGDGQAAGVDDQGRLLVSANGGQVALQSGEVHLG